MDPLLPGKKEIATLKKRFFNRADIFQSKLYPFFKRSSGGIGMFSGIVEKTALVKKIESRGGNKTFFLQSDLAKELSVDQSVSHNGVCLTVEQVLPESDEYRVTAIEETLTKTMLGDLKEGDLVNLERSVGVNSRFDGHFVQGHVDATGVLTEIKKLDGSTEFFIQYDPEHEDLIVPQGSISLMGISLTIASSDPEQHRISVAIIPYTMEVTNIGNWKVGDRINIEFDVLGKYVKKILDRMNPAGSNPS